MSKSPKTYTARRLACEPPPGRRQVEQEQQLVEAADNFASRDMPLPALKQKPTAEPAGVCPCRLESWLGVVKRLPRPSSAWSKPAPPPRTATT